MITFLIVQYFLNSVLQVGAVLVDDQRRIVGVGWNAMPSGIPYMPAEEKKDDPMKDKHTYGTLIWLYTVNSSDTSVGF